MGAKVFSHTHKLTMCGLKKLASGVFPESWSVGRMATAAETDQKQLEQLDCLRSEDTPRRPMITHANESYWIPSQKTKSNLQI